MTGISPENINLFPTNNLYPTFALLSSLLLFSNQPRIRMAITVKILFFASAREAAGCTSASIDLDSDAADTKALR